MLLTLVKRRLKKFGNFLFERTMPLGRSTLFAKLQLNTIKFLFLYDKSVIRMFILFLNPAGAKKSNDK